MNRVVLFAVALGVFALDRISKSVIEATLQLHQSINLVPGLLDLFYTRNTGVAFGLLSNEESPWMSYLLTGVAGIALMIILIFSLRHASDQRRLQWGLMLVFGGAAGNLHDRISYGYVIDFIEVYYRSHHWPTFNAADACISIGIGLLMLDVLLQNANVKDRSILASEESKSNP
ncbi:MAG TPA: signal peptidase II [Terriglobia bacterium]|nr:signal peptidase II [Terriglobia bacterium]